jgi:serine/threonine-protein kinase HipA
VTYQQVDLIEVHMGDLLVGAVAPDPSTGRYVFAYSREWIAGGVELSPLHMPLRAEPYELAMWPDLTVESYKGLPPLLADSLPDAFGNALVNSWMAEHGVIASEITTLDRLGYVADRAMGALEFRPPARDDQNETPSAIQLADLVVAARRTVRGELANSEDAYAALQQLIEVGSSAGGARPKALVAFHPTDYRIHSPFSPLEPGFEHWLIKLDGVGSTGMDGHGDGLGESAPYGRIEYAYYLMAKAAGITMSECRTLAEGPRRHFLTRRFDRGVGGERIHMLSLSAMANLDHRAVGAHSYDQYLATVMALNLSLEELHQAFRRVVFNVMAVNRDDHTKNFSFLLNPSTGWALAPAFDITHAFRRDSQWTSRHNMSVNGKTDAISVADLEAVGERQAVPGYRRAIREVRAAVDGWQNFANAAEVDEASAQAIAIDMEELRPN